MKISNRRLVKAEGADYYPTPAWGTKALIKYEKFIGTILEPCCGDGAMAKILEKTGNKIVAFDLYERGYGTRKDFFDYKKEVNNIVTNPPFNIASEIIEHALPLVKNKLCLLTRTAFLESASRFNRFYSTFPPSRVYVFSERLSMYPAGVTIKGGGTTSYSWLVWDKSVKDKQTTLHWIAPGLKKLG